MNSSSIMNFLIYHKFLSISKPEEIQAADFFLSEVMKTFSDLGLKSEKVMIH